MLHTFSVCALPILFLIPYITDNEELMSETSVSPAYPHSVPHFTTLFLSKKYELFMFIEAMLLTASLPHIAQIASKPADVEKK